MSRARLIQFAIAAGTIVGLFAVLFFGLFAPVLAFAQPPGHDPGHGAIRSSALRVLLVWCFAWPIALVRAPLAPGPAEANSGRARALWTLGCVLLWVHVAVAFHAGHGWSHATAWEHTRAVGGYGDGVFVNYAFALLWLVDVVWAWVSFESYLRRPWWLTGAVHGFFLFIVFNAAVVFGGWAARALFVVFFVIGGWWIASWYRP